MTMAMQAADRLMLFVHYGASPTREEWGRCLDMVRQRAGKQMRVIVENYSGGPNVLQRKSLGEAVRGEDAVCAILTDSGIERAGITAIAWLGLTLRGFPLGAHAEAAEYLKLTPQELKLALELLPRLRRECGMNGTHWSTGS